MPFGPPFVGQNSQDAFSKTFMKIFQARVQEGGARVSTFYQMEAALGEEVVSRQYEDARRGGHTVIDDTADFIMDDQNFYRRIATPRTLYKALATTDDVISNMGESYGFSNLVQSTVDGCMNELDNMVLGLFEADVNGGHGKVFRWNKKNMTIPIYADPYVANAAQAPAPFSGGAWDLGLTVSKLYRAIDILQKNGCQPPYVLFGEKEALSSLRTDPRYSGEEFAYEKAMETGNLRPYGGVNALFNVLGLPKRESIAQGTHGIPAGQQVQINYLVATDYLKLFMVRDWAPKITDNPKNPLMHYVTTNGRFAGMRIEEGSIVAIETHKPDVEAESHAPVRG